jgi:VanZ family protein
MALTRLRLVCFIAKNARPLGWSVVLCILVLSLIPSAHLPKISFYDLFQPDKAGHLMFYGSACLLLMTGYTPRLSRFLIYLVPVCLFLMGLSLEWAQSEFTKDRVFDLWDQTANTLGILCGMALWARFRASFLENTGVD